jgi:hypothetical protein
MKMWAMKRFHALFSIIFEILQVWWTGIYYIPYNTLSQHYARKLQQQIGHYKIPKWYSMDIGSLRHRVVWKHIKELYEVCPNCKSEKWQKNSLRCSICNTWFCLDCCSSGISVVMCPKCQEKNNE